MQRRSFLKTSAALGAAALASQAIVSRAFAAPDAPAATGPKPVVACVEGPDAYASAVKAVELLGGMGKFVKPGATVGLLVNAPGWLKRPSTYARTEIVLAVAKMAADAGAKKIFFLLKIAPDIWTRSPLSEQHKDLTASITDVDGPFVTKEIPKGVAIKKADMVQALFECDVVINVPIFKHHGGTTLSGCLKNVMGTCARETNKFFHSGSTDAKAKEDRDFLAQSIADANLVRKADLYVVDATEFLLNNGPAGPGEIGKADKVFAGTDPVLLDSFGAQLHKRKPADLRVIKAAAAHGIGSMDTAACELREAKLG
ncbi:MAG: DUF362 domain-containing protein [Opitutaceae bacterium]|nr:DUF362 domain-containing protein [Opitutaceae bacterium]